MGCGNLQLLNEDGVIVDLVFPRHGRSVEIIFYVLKGELPRTILGSVGVIQPLMSSA